MRSFRHDNPNPDKCHGDLSVHLSAADTDTVVGVHNAHDDSVRALFDV